MINMMIYRVEIENFYSIRERQIIDLAADEEPRDDSGKVVKVKGNPDIWVPRVVAVFGPNASGKSNVLRAISFVTLFAAISAHGRKKHSIPYFKFKTKKMENSPTRLSISFASNYDFLSKESHPTSESPMTYKYTYKVEFSKIYRNKQEKVNSESLHCRYDNKNICIFDRNRYGKIKMFDKISSHRKLATLEKRLKQNASVISTLFKQRDQFGIDIADIFLSVFTNILIMNTDQKSRHIEKYFKDKELLKSLNDELRRLDLGIGRVGFFGRKDGPILGFTHDGLSGGVSMQLESLGTQKFVANYPVIRDALKNGGVSVIDEFDISLHPMVLPEIVGWFENPRKNPHNAQLWISCHSITLMKNLVMEGIVICEKDRRGSSSVYSLGSVEGVLRNEEFMNGYIRGIYGGIPVIG